MYHTVLVYGTLKAGEGNHRLMDKAKFLGKAVVKGVMYDLGAFPAVSLHGENQIHGELYKVSDTTLNILDRLEGVPNFYQREKVRTSEGDAWIYTMNNDERLSSYPQIKSGEW